MMTGLGKKKGKHIKRELDERKNLERGKTFAQAGGQMREK